MIVNQLLQVEKHGIASLSELDMLLLDSVFPNRSANHIEFKIDTQHKIILVLYESKLDGLIIVIRTPERKKLVKGVFGVRS